MAERVKDDLIQNHYANLVCGPDSYLNLPDMIAQCEMGTNAINIELSKTETYRDIVPQRIGGNRVSGFVSIMRGCNNFCHYCIVPYTRGRERSVMQRASCVRCAICSSVASRKLPCWDRT